MALLADYIYFMTNDDGQHNPGDYLPAGYDEVGQAGVNRYMYDIWKPYIGMGAPNSTYGVSTTNVKARALRLGYEDSNSGLFATSNFSISGDGSGANMPVTISHTSGTITVDAQKFVIDAGGTVRDNQVAFLMEVI